MALEFFLASSYSPARHIAPPRYGTSISFGDAEVDTVKLSRPSKARREEARPHVSNFRTLAAFHKTFGALNSYSIQIRMVMN